MHPADLARREPVAPLSFPRPTSWADQERDTTAWLGNRLQDAAHQRLYRIGRMLKAAGDAAGLEAWRRLTTSDHVYYRCTKFMNVLEDLEQRAIAAGAGSALPGRTPLYFNPPA